MNRSVNYNKIWSKCSPPTVIITRHGHYLYHCCVPNAVHFPSIYLCYFPNFILSQIYVYRRKRGNCLEPSEPKNSLEVPLCPPNPPSCTQFLLFPCVNEQDGVALVPETYSGHPHLKSGSGHRLYWQMFVVLLSPAVKLYFDWATTALVEILPHLSCIRNPTNVALQSEVLMLWQNTPSTLCSTGLTNKLTNSMEQRLYWEEYFHS
jgi:hypothetical protein